MADIQTDIYKEHQQYWHKYIYYLLTINGAAIVYSINKLENRTFKVSILILLAAIICWMVSFFCGIKTLKYALHHIGTRYVISTNENDIDNHLQGDEGLKKMLKDTINESNVKRNKLSGLYYKSQFTFLILGVVFYAIWQIVEMLIRTFTCS